MCFWMFKGGVSWSHHLWKGVSTDPKKTIAMVSWLVPTSVKALKGFLGLTGYYRKFIRHYGQIVAPLTTQLKKNSFVWTPQAKVAFQQLKLVVSQPLVLALPDFNLPFTIECDAFGLGLGVVLMQNQRPNAFHSQVL